MKRTLLAVGLALCSSFACSAPRPVAAVESSAARFPQPVVTDMDGQQVDVAGALRSGRTVVLVFWQTWCATCIVEAPELAAAARAHSDEILFVGVVPGPDGTVDDAEVRRVAQRYDLPYAQVRDRDLSLSHTFAVVGTPTLIALAPDGSEGWRHHRPPEDWIALHRELRQLRGLR